MLNVESEERKRVNRRVEFQAVILCGYGHRYPTVTSFKICFLIYDLRLDPLVQKKSSPKALLPLANKPMLHYVLKWFDDAGVHG
jgi:NDP-sugar pyrophosphorylase family protein